MTHLILIDASGFAHRAYHSRNPLYRESDGLPIWAILGFLEMIWRLMGRAEADKPDFAAAVFDAPGATFRHKLYPSYKANRDPALREELTPQLPFLRDAARALGLAPVEAQGFEADDVIATLARRAAREGIRTSIVSSDKDFGQTVRDGIVEIIDPLQKRRVLAADIEAKMGVRPNRVIDFQALAGDAVDNIKGVPGIGEKGAAGLLRRFGSLDAVLKAAAGRTEYFPARQRMMLRKHRDDALLSRKLATLRTNVPLDLKVNDLVIQPTLISNLAALLKELEAPSRFLAAFTGDGRLDREVPALQDGVDAYEWWRDEQDETRKGQPVPEVPQCGFYVRRLVKGGPWVQAQIWREPGIDLLSGKPNGTDVLHCTVGDQVRNAWREWDALARHPIKRSEYKFAVADAAHARVYRPNDPAANPRKAIDFRTIPVPTVQKRKKA